MILDEVKKLNIPINPGSYQFYSEKGEIIYIGKAVNLKNRVLSYWQKGSNLPEDKLLLPSLVMKIKWIETESEIEALLLEANLIKRYQPQFNIALRDDKRFVYIKVSLADEIPGVFLSRELDKSGRYFGPFVSFMAARETIRAIRKIFPYCTTRKRQSRACFYSQIGLCLGICGGEVSREEYMVKVIKPIILFLEGKKNKIIKNYEARIKNLEKELNKSPLTPLDKGGTMQNPLYQGGKTEGGQDPEAKEREAELATLKFQLKNMQYVLASAKVISVAEKYANDVVELAKQLDLPKIPERIEGYDIANIFGKEAVGSMVVFNGGEPDKNEYRKFKIRIGQGEANDVRMLKEVLERRFRHGTNKTSPTPSLVRRGTNAFIKEGDKQQWPMPDLIVIDGGKGQLNAAVKVLKKYKLNIPLIAIAKGLGLRSGIAPDKLFFPGQSEPLILPLASPALHLIKRVRDEAHRFAISYHRKLRNGAQFK